MDPRFRPHLPLALGSREFLRFLRDYCRSGGWLLGFGLAIRFAQGFTQGFGLVMILPLLASLGYLPGGSAPEALAPFTEALQRYLPEPRLLSALFLFFLFAVLLESARYVESRLQVSIEQDFLMRLRNRLLDAYLSAKWQHLVTIQGSDVSHSLTSDLMRVSAVARQTLNLFFGTIMAACYVGAALYIETAFSLVVLLAGAPLLWILYRRSPQYRAAGGDQREQSRRFFSLLQNTTQGLKLIKSLNLEATVSREASRQMREIRTNQDRLNRLDASSTWLYQIGSVAVILVLLWTGLAWLRVEPAVMLLMAVIFTRLYPRLAGIVRGWQGILPGMVSYHAYRTTMAQLLRQSEDEAVRSGRPTELPFAQALELRNVRFHYSVGSSRAALDGISLRLEPRETIGLVGPSGAGKTTLGDLLLGLLEPASGTIQLDGNPLAGRSLAGWRQQVAYVPQDIHLFHDTIATNLRWSSPNAPEEALWSALRQASAEEFVQALPDGIETVVGDRGHRLSGGERQRIALARALLRKPLFLLLDEATSALDTENERQIQKAIGELRSRLAVCVIAHRLSTLRQVDRIYVLDRGRIVEEGSWDVLASRGGWFARSLRAGS